MRNFLHWLLRLTHPSEDASAILGDLDEERRQRTQNGQAAPAVWVWYHLEFVATLAAGVADRIRRHTNLRPPSSGAQHHQPGFSTGVVADSRFALRLFRRHPGFFVAAVLTLGLGVGATTAMFSVVDAVLLRPLQWSEPDRLAVVYTTHPGRRADPRYSATWDTGVLHYAAWDALRDGAAFEDVAVWYQTRMTLGQDRAELVSALTVSQNLLPLLGARMALGRPFSTSDTGQGANRLILSHELWRTRFGARPDVVGDQVVGGYWSGNGDPDRTWTVVGVLAPDFSLQGNSPDVLRVVARDGLAEDQALHGAFNALVRLAPGVDLQAAEAEAASLLASSEPREPMSGRLVLLADEEVRSSAAPLWMLFGAAGVLLLIACANVAGLLVGEQRTRRREIAIRLAVGGTRGRVLRQLIVELLLLAVVGSLVGLLFSGGLTQMIVAFAPADLPRLDTVQVNWRIGVFALGIGSATVLIFGLAPAMSLARTDAAPMSSDVGQTAKPQQHVALRSIVAAEVALAVVLVVAAGLFGETMFRLLSRPLGFDPSNLTVVDTTFTGPKLGANSGDVLRQAALEGRDQTLVLNELQRVTSEARTAAIIQRLAAVPAVLDVAGLAFPPFVASPRSVSVGFPGRPVDEADVAGLQFVTNSVLKTLGLSLVEGRDFGTEDALDAALVSREFANRYFPDGALGQTFAYLWGSTPDRRTTYRVIGVVDDLKHSARADRAAAVFYAPGSPNRFVIRADGDRPVSAAAVRSALNQVDSQIVVNEVSRMDQMMAGLIAAERFRAMLSSLFAGAALLLAAVGLYGAASSRVADRRKELGIRVALGAAPANLRALVFNDTLRTIGMGLAVGLPTALAGSQLTRALLFGVSPTAPHVFLSATVAMVVSALLATLPLARRAARIDPVRSLKE